MRQKYNGLPYYIERPQKTVMLNFGPRRAKIYIKLSAMTELTLVSKQMTLFIFHLKPHRTNQICLQWWPKAPNNKRTACQINKSNNKLEKICFFSRHKLHAGRQSWPWPSNSSKQGTKHVFPVNLEQIRLAVHEIFHTQTKSRRQRQKTEPYAVHCVRFCFWRMAINQPSRWEM